MVEIGHLSYAKHASNEDFQIEAQWYDDYISEPLPETFKPGNWDVLCCGGKEGSEHAGNKRYRQYIATSMQAYIDATSRWEKSTIVKSIIESVRRSCESSLNKFVKKDTNSGRWYNVGNKALREKVSHALRDAIKAQRKREARARHVAKLKAHRLPTTTLRDHKGNGTTVISQSIHLDRQFGAIVSDDDDDDSLFSNVEVAIVNNANDEWKKSLQTSTECFLRSGESETCFGIPM